MQEYMLDAYKKHDIIVEKINLADLVYNRDFDKLYDQIKESYNLKSRFSNENKQIVNDIWDKRIENLKNLGWW
jgi:hypothetical protein